MITFNRVHSAVVHAKGDRQQLLGVHMTEQAADTISKLPHFASLLKEIKEEAERARSEALPELPFSVFHLFASQGTRKEYENPYFDKRGRLLALVLDAWLHPQQSDLEALHNVIWSICDEYTWSLPSHIAPTLEGVEASRVPPEQVVDLFASETAHALAETLYLLEGRLNPWVVYRVRREIEARVFHPLFDSPKPFHWESAIHNWSAVCGGAVGMAALLLEEDRERLAGMIDRVVRAMGSFLEGYEADGCCAEGVGYWSYGFGYYTYFAEMLFAFTDGELSLLQSDKIRRIAAFPAGVSVEAPKYVNFSDCSENYTPSTGLLSRLHLRTGQPVPVMTEVPSLHADHCYRFPQTVRNLLWTDPELLFGKVATGTFYYPDTAWVVDKQLLSGSLFAFAAKGGHNDEPHNHNDLGHFLLHVAGENLLADLGAGVYTREYFGEGRYQYLHNASEGHSVPLINGMQQSAGRSFTAEVLRYEHQDNKLMFSLDLAGAYPQEAGLRSLIRSFTWSCDESRGEAELVLTDAFAFTESLNEVKEVFISLHEPILETGSVIWRGNSGEVKLFYDANLFKVQHEAIDSQDHHAQAMVVHRIRLEAKAVPSEAFYSFRFVCK
ncbi:heparinase II/III family protein [Paenibacillus sp. N3.4]|uniref:heparinase II/III family protein n=1 Tax=Paenibacillus sp. N3.4 TaxID=2603222 RepID=UPI0011CAB0BB|nr:heparinase II/III family protein [Paenibacillus sp. N3.4]TXK74565.1 hypothetical protein FU659_29020 [Paenibacillus sp. N3.4]